MEFSSWLDERFVHDVKARNTMVEKKCFSHFDTLDEINIVDIGSGTGSTFLAMYNKIEKDQIWTFLEQDVSLIEYSIDRIKKVLSTDGYEISTHESGIVFAKNKRKIELKWINDSLLNIDKVLDLTTIDLVTASAIFDLFSIEQYIQFDELLRASKVSILSVMNYTGMSFSTDDAYDKQYIDAYHSDMIHPKEIGIGMGPNCFNEIDAYYKGLDSLYFQGESIWNLDEDCKSMHAYLLEYMENALMKKQTDQSIFKNWLVEKRKLSKAGKLSMCIEHFDYFVS